MKKVDNSFNNIPDVVFHSEKNDTHVEKVMLNQN